MAPTDSHPELLVGEGFGQEGEEVREAFVCRFGEGRGLTVHQLMDRGVYRLRRDRHDAHARRDE